MYLHDDQTLTLFEFDKVREHIASHCRHATSTQMALKLSPIMDRATLKLKLAQANEFQSTQNGAYPFPDSTFEDFKKEVQLLLLEGSVLTEKSFHQLRLGLTLSNHLLKFIADRSQFLPSLNFLIEKLSNQQDTVNAIDEIIDQQAQVKSSASKELTNIRATLHHLHRDADKKFNQLVNELRKKGYLRDNKESFFNNRRVICMLSEHRRSIGGIVHGRSDSGKTTFVEPEELVEINNEIAALEQDELHEINRLLRILTDSLRIDASQIKLHHHFLMEIDLLRAKSIFSRSIGGQLPQIEQEPILALDQAVHPLLYLQNKKSGKQVIPLSISLNKEKRLVIISGPNAGGKSIVLKTIGILQIMFQSGLLIPVKEKSRLSFFNHLLIDIGDAQSIENALSTYSSRLIRMKSILATANQRSLVLIDEFGTGTDPELGGAIAEVMLEELSKKNAFGILTTHYTNIKLIASKLPGALNANMQFDPATLSPKYQLVIGEPGSSYTFEVAEKIGLPKSVLERAKSKVQREKIKLNSLLADLQSQKNNLKQNQEKLEAAITKAENSALKLDQLQEKISKNANIDQQKKINNQLFIDLGKKLNSLINEWEKSKDKKGIFKKFAGLMNVEYKKRAAENTPEKASQRQQKKLEYLQKTLQVGMNVRALQSKQVGQIEQIKKDEVLINYGGMKMTVAMVNIEIVNEQEKKVKKESNTSTKV